jgi:hypothetical protein
MCASFCAGTKILSTRGRVRIENLRVGDEVITFAGHTMPIRWIGERTYRRHFARLSPGSVPILIKAGALDDGVPSRDVYVSPAHRIYLDGVLVAASDLVNHASILACPEMDPISYFHLELSAHAILLAEDMPAESYVERGNRAMFLRTSYATPYDPTVGTPAWTSCAPLVQRGMTLDRIRDRLALRAGIIPPDIMEKPQSGPLIGQLEWADHRTLSGWAWLPDHPVVPVVLEILDHGEIIAVTIANHYRDDLERAGIGDGFGGFHVDLSRPLDPSRPHTITVRRAADSQSVPGSPVALPASAPLHALEGLDLTALAAQGGPTEMVRLLAWLEQQAAKLQNLLEIDPHVPPWAGVIDAASTSVNRRARRSRIVKPDGLNREISVGN